MKILLIQFKRIGDLILTSPVLAVLQRQYPEAQIDLAAESGSAGILPAFPQPHGALIFKRGHLNLGNLAAIAREQYDICLDFNGSDRSLLVSALSRAKRRILYQKFSKRFLRSSVYTDWVDSPVRKRHTVDHFLDLLRPLGISVEGERPILRIPDKDQTEAERALRNAGVASPYAVIHAGTARAEKLWQPGRWASVAKWMQEKHSLKVVLTGVESDRRIAGIDQIISASDAACIDMVGKLSLLETAAVIGRARVLCSVDSAPIHIAEALNTPVVALFAPMNPYVWMPRHTASRILHPKSPDGVFSPETPAGAMEEIPVEQVIQKVDEMINLSR